MSMYEIIEETQTATEKTQSGASNVDTIVLLVDDFQNFGKKSYDINILGASMFNWVVRSAPSAAVLVNYNEDDDLLQTIRPMLKNAEYTLVLFSDTPLITKAGVKEIIDYAVQKDLPVCKFERAYMFKTEYLKNAQAVYAMSTHDVQAKELVKIDSIDKLVFAQKVLSERIAKYHLSNGVVLTNPQNTYIDCTVSIDAGAVIEPFVKLEGTTTIGANSKICSNSVIIDSKIDEHVIVKNSCNIVSSAVNDNAIIGNNCVIMNKSVVGEESIISAGANITNSTTNKDCKIGEMALLINTKLATNVTICAAAKCIGSDISDVKVGSGATIGEGSAILAGAYIKQDVSVPAFTNIKGN